MPDWIKNQRGTRAFSFLSVCSQKNSRWSSYFLIPADQRGDLCSWSVPPVGHLGKMKTGSVPAGHGHMLLKLKMKVYADSNCGAAHSPGLLCNLRCRCCLTFCCLFSLLSSTCTILELRKTRPDFWWPDCPSGLVSFLFLFLFIVWSEQIFSRKREEEIL